MTSMTELFYGHNEPTYIMSNYADRSTYMQPRLELQVPMCCTKCEKKVKNELLEMDGVQGVVCDQFRQKVTVAGDVNPEKVLKCVKRIKDSSDFWTRSSHHGRSAHVRSSSGYAESSVPYSHYSHSSHVRSSHGHSSSYTVSPPYPPSSYRDQSFDSQYPRFYSPSSCSPSYSENCYTQYNPSYGGSSYNPAFSHSYSHY